MSHAGPNPAGAGLGGKTSIGTEGLLSAAAEHPEIVSGMLNAVSAAQQLDARSALNQAEHVRSAEDAIDAVESVANKLAGTAAGQQVLAQAAKAKTIYDAQTTNRITKIADAAIRGTQAKLMERARGPGGGLLRGMAGTLGGIADQAAGPSAAVALSNEAPGTRTTATRNPPTLPTKLQVATMLANEEHTDQSAAAAFRAGDKDGKGGLSKLEAQATIQYHFQQQGNSKESPTLEHIGNLFGARTKISVCSCPSSLIVGWGDK